MKRKGHYSRKQSSQMNSILKVLLIIAAVLFIVLVIVENTGLAAPADPTGDESSIQGGQQTPETDPPKETEETVPPTTVSSDAVPPVISGVKDLQVYLGDAVSYRSGVTVSDETDPNPVLSIDSTGVDLSAVGTYQVVYTATDASGNTASETATVTIMEKQAGYADLDTIYSMADEVISQIITPDMTTRQQVRAIYNFARSSFGYSGHSDKSDWRQGAYVMLTTKQGDCFNYYAVCKLLFERLEIPNIDVRKVKNYDGDSDHFWSLVSIDGGENYYHFDSTPRVGDGDNFCLVTDAFLDAYSAKHKNCHNRDKSLYPATPEEALS